MKKRDISPEAVASRLEALRVSWVPMTAEEAAALLRPPPRKETLAEGAKRRLDELKALMDLTEHLRRARVDPRQAPR